MIINSLRLLFIAGLFVGFSAFAMEEPNAKKQEVEKQNETQEDVILRFRQRLNQIHVQKQLNKTLKNRCLECIAKNIESKNELEEWFKSDYREIIFQSAEFFRALSFNVIRESEEILMSLIDKGILGTEASEEVNSRSFRKLFWICL